MNQSTYTPRFSDSALKDLPALLERGIVLLHRIGQSMEVQERSLISLRERLAEGRFHLAILGQFKRGKSTLLNALLGEEILPSSVIPLTAIPTFLRYAPERKILVRYQDGRMEEMAGSGDSATIIGRLLDLVSEEKNPKNVRGISYVEITHPSELLKEFVLIDTPGIGSAHRHNTEMTLNFLAQCDAALFLVSTDPPITEVELEFLKEVMRKVPRIFFVLNKIDYLSRTEREIAIQYLRRMLAERAGVSPDGEIFPVSARTALLAKERGDQALLNESGLLQVTDYLVESLANEKIRILQEAIAGKALDLLNDARLHVSLEQKSLELPIRDLETRLALFRQKIEDAKRERMHAQDILNGDRQRVLQLLEEECAGLRERAMLHLDSIAENAFSKNLGLDPTAVRDEIAQEIPAFFEHALGDVTARFDRELIEVLSTHRNRAFALVESIRQAASSIFEIPHHPTMAMKPLKLAREPYWVTRRTWSGMLTAISPDLFEKALPRAMREQRMKSRMKKEIEMLVVQNVENLRWATVQNIEAAFRVFSRELDEDLSQAIEATHGAISAAYMRRKEHSEEIAGRASRLDNISTELNALLQEFNTAISRA